MQRSNSLEPVPTGASEQRAAIVAAQKALGGIILGKDRQISLALACLLARGHLLIEDLPGLGKTMLAQGLARVLRSGGLVVEALAASRAANSNSSPAPCSRN